MAVFGTVTGTSDLMIDPLTIIDIPVTLTGPILANYQLLVTFPSDYILNGGYCKVIDSVTSKEYSITCTDIDTLNK